MSFQMYFPFTLIRSLWSDCVIWSSSIKYTLSRNSRGSFYFLWVFTWITHLILNRKIFWFVDDTISPFSIFFVKNYIDKEWSEIRFNKGKLVQDNITSVKYAITLVSPDADPCMENIWYFRMKPYALFLCYVIRKTNDYLNNIKFKNIIRISVEWCLYKLVLCNSRSHNIILNAYSTQIKIKV